MATVSLPYGLQPLHLLGGQSYAGSIRLYKLPANYSTAIYFGDPVIITSTGSNRGNVARFSTTLTAATETTSATIVGVAIGVQYTDPNTSQFTVRQHYPGSINASDIFVHVIDDPDCLFEVQAGGTVPQTALGCNFSLLQIKANGNSNGGNSYVGIKHDSLANTATLPIRLVDFMNSPTSTIGDAFTDCIVRINTHFHRTATGTSAT